METVARARGSISSSVFCVVCSVFLLLFVVVNSGLAQVAVVGERAREVSDASAGDVVVTINERLLNALLEAMFSLPNPPKFPLTRNSDVNSTGGARGCPSEVTLLREMSGNRTVFRFSDDRINTIVAFRGSYEMTLAGCLHFEGWADANLDLSFDQTRQALSGRIVVNELNLKNVPALMKTSVTSLVQTAIDSRINPLELLRTDQLGARIPITPENTLRLRAKEVRHEVRQRELLLRIFYEAVHEK